MKRRLSSSVFVALLTLACVSSPLSAADYPNRPITAINPVPPGGSNDVIGRAFATLAEKYLGQPIVMVNRPGASGKIGTLEGMKATPDGYTLTVASTARTATIEWEIANGRKPPFTRHDFLAIGSFTLSPTVLVVPYNSPWKTLADFIKDLKAKPNQYAFGSGGLYGSTHLPVEIFMHATGIKARHVPFKGGGEVLPAVVGGHVDFAFQFPSTTIPLMRGNKLRPLVVTSDRRSKFVPEVPTCKELGVDAEFYQWVGLLAPKKTPMAIVQRLRDVAKKVVEEPAFHEMIEKAGDEVRPLIGDELVKYWDIESARFAKIYAQLPKEKEEKR